MWNPLHCLFGAEKVKAAEAKVRAEIERIRNLGPDEAEREAQEALAQVAAIQGWVSPPISTIEARLAVLDHRLAEFLRRYRRYVFSESGTIISAEYLDSELLDGIWQIANNHGDEFALGAKAGSPLIYEIAGRKVRDQLPSIFHYILLGEGELES